MVVELKNKFKSLHNLLNIELIFFMGPSGEK
nr:MAG TPA: hypothetical protein [Caudoviricetes sp.]